MGRHRPKLGQQIPLDPVEISIRYGSGQFVAHEFSLSVYNVFHPIYPSLVQFRRMALELDIQADRQHGVHVLKYDHPFPIGGFEYGPEQRPCNIIWDMKGSMENWPLWLPTPSAPAQHFGLPLTEFLVKAFRGELDVDRFPKPFVDLRFVAWKEQSTT